MTADHGNEAMLRKEQNDLIMQTGRASAGRALGKPKNGSPLPDWEFARVGQVT
jgi:hypothetical protein